jgi:hypothetical protein
MRAKWIGGVARVELARESAIKEKKYKVVLTVTTVNFKTLSSPSEETRAHQQSFLISPNFSVLAATSLLPACFMIHINAICIT